MTQGIKKQVGILPAIEAKTHLFQVRGEMFGADVVPRSHDAALEQTESGLHSVCVNVAFDIDPSLVLNLLVRHVGIEFDNRANIGWEFIGNDYVCILADVFLDVLCQRASLHILSAEESE